jgi:hypothetical protein
MKSKIIVAALVVVLSGCDPYKRIIDYCEKYPDKCIRTSKDSIIIRESKFDTLVSYSYSKDSFLFFDTINKTLVKKYYFKDSFFTTLKSAPCTTYIKQNIIAPIKPQKESIWKQIKDFLILFTIVVLFILVIFVLLWILK